MVFGEQPSQRSESNRWEADGILVYNFPKIHDDGHPRRGSEIHEKYTV